MGNCSIHGKHSGKTCGFCGLGNRIKDLSVHQENVQLKQRIKELEEQLNAVRDAVPWEWLEMANLKYGSEIFPDPFEQALERDDE